VLDRVKAATPTAMIPLELVAILGDPVADRVVTQNELNGLMFQMASRIEVLETIGTVISPIEVSEAR